MSLSRLKATNFRNFSALDIEPGEHFNLIYGANGSGKTSILEAIHYISLGRSFRTHLCNRIILYDSSAFSVFGLVKNQEAPSMPVGIEKSRNSKTKIKISNEMVPSAAELAKILPLQIINPDSYLLLSAGPRHRRQFLDWGVFHVEQRFFSVWQRFQRVLKQRNSALQQGVVAAQVMAWNKELIPYAEELAELRANYLQQLIPVVTKILTELIQLNDLTITYEQGWDKQSNLEEILAASFKRDSMQGYTQYGPQRADVIIKSNNMPVEDVLSRGEQKLLVCALKLAQGILLHQLTGKRCIYLLDDLAAELDSKHRQRIVEVLADLKAQVFITAVDAHTIGELLHQWPTKVFHVEHGAIR